MKEAITSAAFSVKAVFKENSLEPRLTWPAGEVTFYDISMCLRCLYF